MNQETNKQETLEEAAKKFLIKELELSTYKYLLYIQVM